MKGERDRLILLTWDGTREEEEVRVQQKLPVDWGSIFRQSLQCHALSLKWAIECVVCFEDRAFYRDWQKRRGCLLSYSQAEPGRDLSQPSPRLIAEPCTDNPESTYEIPASLRAILM